MANTVIQLKKSATPLATPGSLANGELAINYADGKLFYKDSTGTIQQISSGGNTFSTVNAAGTLVVADLQNDILTLDQGDNIIITGDAINDKITIAANLAPAFNKANASYTVANSGFDKANSANVLAKAAYDFANTLGGGGATISNTAPSSPSSGSLWWNSLYGRLLVYYNDGDTSQWVETTQTTAPGGYYQGNNGNVGAPSGVGDIFRTHTNTLTSDVTIPSGNNSIVTGPLILGSSVTLIISSGARVVIV